MASYTANVAKSATLGASVVDTITLPRQVNAIEVLSRDGTAEISFTVDGSTPTLLGDDCYVVPATIGGLEVDTIDSPADTSTVVKLIASAATAYTVQATVVGR